MSRVRLVVFDLDGTLVDTAADLAAAVNDTIAQLGPGTPPLPLGRVRGWVGSGAATLIARSLEAAGLEARIEGALSLFLESYRGRMLETSRLYAGVIEALDDARLSGRKLAVLTNKPGDMARAILAGLGVADRFFRICGGGDVPGKKPDPAGLLRLLDEARTAPRQAVVVGDSAIDVLTARAAGAWAVGAGYGFDPVSLAEVSPDHTIDDLRLLEPWLTAMEQARSSAGPSQV